MASLNRDAISVIAESVGIANLSNDIASGLASDVEYRLRELVQDASRFMRHAHRSTLSTDDVNHALRQANIEPLYGYFPGASALRFTRAAGAQDVYFVDDRELDFHDILAAPLPRCPRETTFTAHWLAVEGVQPAIPQNVVPADELRGKRRKTAPESKTATTENTEVKPVVRHVLSKELQLYYEKVTSSILGDDRHLRRTALRSVANDAGLRQLVPYLTQFVSDEVTRNLRNLSALHSLMCLVNALLDSTVLHVEPYLHQLMPVVLTCLVGRRLCGRVGDDHWALRDMSAGIVAKICARFGQSYHTLQARVTKTLLQAFMDPVRPLTTQYGAIVGLSSLGTQVATLLLLPNIPIYLRILVPELTVSPNMAKRAEASRCYGALVHVTGQFLYNDAGHYCRSLTKQGPSHVRRKRTRIVRKKKDVSAMDTSADANGNCVADKDGGVAGAAKGCVKRSGGGGPGAGGSKGLVDVDIAELCEVFGESMVPFTVGAPQFFL